MPKTMQVVICKPGGFPMIQEIPSSLEGMQAVVGGLIELVRLGRFDLFCNEEGLLQRLPFNRVVGDTHIVGTFFVCKADAEGESCGLTDSDVREVLHLLG
jgi:hypothetical protein